jgi:hypothetical protein
MVTSPGAAFRAEPRRRRKIVAVGALPFNAQFLSTDSGGGDCPGGGVEDHSVTGSNAPEAVSLDAEDAEEAQEEVDQGEYDAKPTAELCHEARGKARGETRARIWFRWRSLESRAE